MKRRIQLPAIADLPKDIHPTLRKILLSMIETMEIREGVASEADTEQFVTRRDLAGMGLDPTIINTAGLVYQLPTTSISSDHTPPNNVTNVQVEADSFHVKVTWAYPAYYDIDVARIEVYKSTFLSTGEPANDRANAALIGVVPYPQTYFVDTEPSYHVDEVHYYVYAVDTSENYAALTADSWVSTVSTIEGTLNHLIDQLLGPNSESTYANEMRILADAFTVYQPFDETRTWVDTAAYTAGDVVGYKPTNDTVLHYYVAKNDIAAASSSPNPSPEDATADWDELTSEEISSMSSARPVFRVGKVDDNTTIGIRGDLIVDGSIGARQILAGSIDVDHLKADETLTWSIKSHGWDAGQPGFYLNSKTGEQNASFRNMTLDMSWNDVSVSGADKPAANATANNLTTGGTTAPATASEGDFWLSDGGTLWVHNGSAWTISEGNILQVQLLSNDGGYIFRNNTGNIKTITAHVYKNGQLVTDTGELAGFKFHWQNHNDTIYTTVAGAYAGTTPGGGLYPANPTEPGGRNFQAITINPNNVPDRGTLYLVCAVTDPNT